MPESRRHWAVAGSIVLVLALLRLVVVGPDELDDLTRFREATGVPIGPGTAFHASGLDGDGAAFAIMALDPFGQDLGERLFAPSYRYWRFGYPWMAALLVLGYDEVMLVGLSAVGLLAAGITAYLASRLSETRKAWAWLLVCNPALILGVLGDTAEPLAVTLLGLSIFTGSALVGWSVSLVRPDFLVALASRPIVFLSGAVTAVLTKWFWSWHFDESILENEGTVTWPFAGYIAAPSLLGWVIAAIALITLVVGVSRRDVSWILSGLLVMCFGPVVVDTPTNALRAAGFLPVLWAFGPGFEPVTPLRRLFWAGGSPAVTSPNLLLP